MTQVLRHFAARIWFSLLLGGLISLWLLPHFQDRIGIARTLFAVIAILVLIYVFIGWVSTTWGLSSAKHWIHEAGTCERDGMYPEAEAAFGRAVAVFDSFLISPFVKQKKSPSLAARIARFHLALADKHRESEEFLVAYLCAHPDDEEVAESWLNQIESRGGLREEHQEVAYRIGGAQPKNKTIQFGLARFYLIMERTDFPALQTYRRVFGREDQAPPEFIDNLAGLFYQERRADEWALKIYLQAFARDRSRKKLLRGIAACLRWTPETERNTYLRQKARTYLEGLDKLQLKKMSAGFKPPAPTPAPPKQRRKIGVNIYSGNLVRNALDKMIRGTYSTGVRIVGQLKSYSNSFKHSRTARRIFAGIVLVGLSAVVAVLIVNTISHLTRTDKAVKEKTEPAAVVVTDPFTIQVAAYLKPDYAYKYVAKLKKQGLDAYWTEVTSGNKKWYQVRVSHFPDKDSARQYAESLKAKGIIDDYYVANYQR
jgi:hypothetical protein